MKGKGIFLWNVKSVHGGRAAAIADLLVSLGMERVEVKVADGISRFNDPYLEALVPELKGRGLMVGGWSYVYGTFPDEEGRLLAQRVEYLGLDYGVADAERHLDTKEDAPARAAGIAHAYRAATDKPLGLCSWPLPYNPAKPKQEFHPVAVIKALLSVASFVMPMAYPVPLRQCPYDHLTPEAYRWWVIEPLRQWSTLTDKPVVMAGRAYDGDHSRAVATGITAFGQAAHELGLSGISLWSLEHLLKVSDPNVLDAVKGIARWGQPVEEPEVPVWTPRPEAYYQILEATGLLEQALGKLREALK